MKKTVVIAILLYGVSAFAQSGEMLGKISQVNTSKKEVVISSPRAAEKFVVGDRLVVRVGNERIVLRVLFPMMTLAKCSVDQSSAGKIGLLAPGQFVYRFSGEEKRTVRFYETWDSDYLTKTRKIRFIREIPAGELANRNYYFEVVYDAHGLIVKTVEIKTGKQTTVDYYSNDRIIKKELYDEKTGRLVKTQRYDESGIMTEEIIDNSSGE